MTVCWPSAHGLLDCTRLAGLKHGNRPRYGKILVLGLDFLVRDDNLITGNVSKVSLTIVCSSSSPFQIQLCLCSSTFKRSEVEQWHQEHSGHRLAQPPSASRVGRRSRIRWTPSSLLRR